MTKLEKLFARITSSPWLPSWTEAVGRAGVLHKARPKFFARLFGFEYAPPGDFSESTLVKLRSPR